MTRFDRSYEMIAAGIVIKSPLRVVFDATKSINGGLNRLTARIYNLTRENQKALARDESDKTQVPVILSVGYENRLESIFIGDLISGSTVREGGDLITTIECFDGGIDYRFAITSKTVDVGGDIIDAILDDMPNTTKGKVSERVELTRPKVLVGASSRLVDELMAIDETWYIEDGQLFALKDNEVTGLYIPVVSAESGLMTTPEKSEKEVTFQTKLNPSIKIGGLCQLVSQNAPDMNGIYKVETITYSGDNYGGPWDQSCVCVLTGDVVAI